MLLECAGQITSAPKTASTDFAIILRLTSLWFLVRRIDSSSSPFFFFLSPPSSSSYSTIRIVRKFNADYSGFVLFTSFFPLRSGLGHRKGDPKNGIVARSPSADTLYSSEKKKLLSVFATILGTLFMLINLNRGRFLLSFPVRFSIFT